MARAAGSRRAHGRCRGGRRRRGLRSDQGDRGSRSGCVGPDRRTDRAAPAVAGPAQRRRRIHGPGGALPRGQERARGGHPVRAAPHHRRIERRARLHHAARLPPRIVSVPLPAPFRRADPQHHAQRGRRPDDPRCSRGAPVRAAGRRRDRRRPADRVAGGDARRGRGPRRTDRRALARHAATRAAHRARRP